MPRTWYPLVAKQNRQNRLTKPATGRKRHALVNVPSTEGTFDDARTAFESGGYDGIGFVQGEGIFGIDFDNASGEMVKGALSPGFCTEFSPGGRGIHVLGLSGMQLKGRKKGSVELYMQGRYFTISGAVAAGSGEDLREIPDTVLTVFFRLHFTNETPGNIRKSR